MRSVQHSSSPPSRGRARRFNATQRSLATLETARCSWHDATCTIFFFYFGSHHIVLCFHSAFCGCEGGGKGYKNARRRGGWKSPFSSCDSRSPSRPPLSETVAAFAAVRVLQRPPPLPPPVSSLSPRSHRPCGSPHCGPPCLFCGPL
jgi:hypothetical protein